MARGFFMLVARLQLMIFCIAKVESRVAFDCRLHSAFENIY